MCNPIAAAVVVGVIKGVQSFSSAEAARRQKLYQAGVMRSNATAQRQQAEVKRKQTEIEQRRIDQQKIREKRAYREAAGTNTSLLAAGNVDLTSGSPLALLEGNASRFAGDMGEMDFNKALVGWAGNREADIMGWRGDVYDSQASYLKNTAGSTGGSLLSGGMSGAMAGFSTYFMAGGSMGGGAASSGIAPGSYGKAMYGQDTQTLLNQKYKF